MVRFFDRNVVAHGWRCLRSRHRESSCTRCALLCPHHAIALGTTPTIDLEKCTGCGVCIGVCPTGAFELPGFSYAGILTRLPGRDNVMIACGRSHAGADLIVPCLGALNADFLIASAILADSDLALDSSPCAACDGKEGLQVALATAIFACAALEQAGIESRPRIAPVRPAGSEDVSRRDLFSYVRSQAATAVARAISEEEGTETPVRGLPSLASPTRALAISLLRKKAGPPVPHSGTLPFYTLSIAAGCDGCGICAKYCSTGALSLEQAAGKLSIRHNPSDCIGCGLCHDACSRRLINLRPLQSMEPVLSGETLVLFQTAVLPCARCGHEFAPHGG
ncbi:MAG: 4Fe-4S binding protein, partial [Chloroflexi bacterium]|nr:4Fe-4S binding protein [Chloroflexota bacterium]